MTIGIGIIGAGSISEMHLRAYHEHPEVKLLAICDLNESRAQAKAEKYNIPYTYQDVHELLAREDIDAVSICTWNHSHVEWAFPSSRRMIGSYVCEKSKG